MEQIINNGEFPIIFVGAFSGVFLAIIAAWIVISIINICLGLLKSGAIWMYRFMVGKERE
jgi:hypothetical protein